MKFVAAPRWVTGVAGAFLAVSSLYLLAIRVASPHPLPGLVALCGLVFAAGLAFVFRAAIWPRAEGMAHVLVMILGLAAIADIAYVGLKRPTRHAARP